MECPRAKCFGCKFDLGKNQNIQAIDGIILLSTYTYAYICIYTTMCMHFPSDHSIISCLFKTTKLKMAIMLVKRSIREKACSAMGLF